MNDPVRLLDGEATAEERALLQAASGDAPESEAEQRLLLRLGLVSQLSPTGHEQGAAAVGDSAAAPASLGKGTLALAGKLLAAAVFGAGMWLVAQPPREATTVAPRPPPAQPSPPSPSPAAEVPTGQRDSLRLEVAALDRVRGALAHQDAAEALSLLSAYRQRHPQGVLSQEAAVLQLEALQYTHDPKLPELARAFLEAHPDSPHAERVRLLWMQAEKHAR